jgi:Domain of unknown function (DUF4253)
MDHIARTSMAALAEDPTGTGVGLHLPAGRIIHDVAGTASMWLSDTAPDRELLEELHACAGRTGLWPVALNMEGFSMPVEPGWPQAPLDAQVILSDWSARLKPWNEDHDHLNCHACMAMSEHWRTYPARAITRESDQDAARTAAEVASLMLPYPSSRLGLIACERSADVLAALGWDGPVNYGNPIAEYSAVLRRWEERFNARVVVLDGAALMCSVASPPRSFDQALELAREQVAFCPDLTGESDSVKGHADTLVGSSMWSFWWD